METYENLKNKQIERLEKQIEILSNLNVNQSVSAQIEGFKMEFDSEILLKEKQEELKNVDLYYARILEIFSELIENGQKIGALKKEQSEEIEMFLKGIKFTFKKDKLLLDFELEKEKLSNELKEIKQYFETGKLTL